ncbi:MAG: SDR family oxidoreductase, partial [Myxococcota bacterium]|nr:SDR family oxidoreductase [Myxococcota bacterium]
ELVTDQGEGIRRRQLDMTLDVMANSLVYWVQGLVGADLLGQARIFALTSTGAHSAWASYGAVSAAKAALESYVRQLCLELAPRGVTVNAILAGVTRTAALSKIPNSENIVAKAISKNPHNRLTRPEDVAACLVELSRPGTYWMTGNIIRVDGGEDFCA